MTDKETKIRDIMDRASSCGKTTLLYTEDVLGKESKSAIEHIKSNFKEIFSNNGKYIIVTDNTNIYHTVNNLVNCSEEDKSRVTCLLV